MSGINNLNRNGGSSRSASSSPTDRNRLLPVPNSTSSPLASRPTSPSPILPPPSPPPLHITVRFSIAALPDLELDVLTPHKTTVVALKHRIRSRLAEQGAGADNNNNNKSTSFPAAATNEEQQQASAALGASKSRLRFIHAGKILPDKSPLSSVLRTPLPPPPSSSANNQSSSSSGKGKGKHIEGRNPSSTARVYVNCSIGDQLSESDLAEEARAAALPVVENDSKVLSSTTPTPPRSSPSPFGYGSTATTTTTTTTPGRTGSGLRVDTSMRNNNNGTTTTSGTGTGNRNNPPLGGGGGNQDETEDGTAATSVPRGFDRYRAGGLPVEEIQSLRRQFRANVAMRHTPDTMPSPEALLRMEDAWIDTNAPGAAGGGGGTDWDVGIDVNEGTATTTTVAEDNDDGSLAQVSDQLIMGMIVGFFFPLGAIGWVLREPGMLSKRWQMFIILGVALSISLGSVRVLMGGSGDDGDG